MKNSEIARKLAPLLGREDWKNISSHLSMIFHGQRTLPVEWEPHLISILECSDRNGLLVLFPDIKTKRGSNILVEVELMVTTPIGSVPAGMLPEVIRFIQVIDQFGIKVELRVRAKES